VEKVPKSMRTDDVQVTMFVPFYAYHTVPTETKFVHSLLNDEEKQNWLSVWKGMEAWKIRPKDRYFLHELSCFQR
jgi:hypothetical protein